MYLRYESPVRRPASYLTMMIDATTVKLRVHGNGMDVQWFDVKWFGVQLVTDAAVRSLVTKALGLPAGTDLVCRHSCDGSVVALGAAIPDGLLLDVHVSMTGCRVAGAFKKQLIKFENIQAHLANERTWLAWVRTSLSALSVAFSLLTLVGDSRESWLAVVLGASQVTKWYFARFRASLTNF